MKSGKFSVSALDYEPVRTPKLQRRGDGLEVASVFCHADLPSYLFCVAVDTGKSLSPEPPGILEKQHVFHLLLLPMVNIMSDKSAEAKPASWIWSGVGNMWMA